MTSSRIIVISGPKGGVGSSACTVSLARALCGRERRVLVIGHHSDGPGLRYLLDIEQTECISAEPSGTSMKSLDAARLSAIPDDIDDFCDSLKSSGYDDVIIDLCTSQPRAYDLFLRADIPVLIAMPEPTSLDAAVCWLRHAISRHLALMGADAAIIQEVSAALNSWKFTDIYPKLTPAQQTGFVSALSKFKCAFLLNGRRDNSESLQAMALCHALSMLFGVDIAFLGALVYDERRWFYERRLADVSLFMREDPLVREFIEIIREKLDGRLFGGTRVCLPVIQVQLHPRQFLRAETSAAARQAYRQLWEGYCRENGLVSVIMPADMIAQTMTLLETAWRRAEFEDQAAETVQGAEKLTGAGAMPEVSRRFSSTFAAVRRYDPSACDPEAGAFLKKRCVECQISIGQLAIRSRIPQKMIERIEDLNIAGIPAPRLQAYLFELAKVLDINFEDLKRRFGL